MRDLTNNRSVLLASAPDRLASAVADLIGPDRDVDAALEFRFLCVSNEGQETSLGEPVPRSFSPFLRTTDLCPLDGTGAEAYTASVDVALELAEAVAPRYWPTILHEARADLNQRFGWHVSFPRPGQRKALAPAIVRALLAHVASEAAEDTPAA